MIAYVQVIIHSQCRVRIINFIKNQQTIISVIGAIEIYHNIEKSQCIRAFQQVHILNYHIVFHNC